MFTYIVIKNNFKISILTNNWAGRAGHLTNVRAGPGGPGRSCRGSRGAAAGVCDPRRSCQPCGFPSHCAKAIAAACT